MTELLLTNCSLVLHILYSGESVYKVYSWNRYNLRDFVPLYTHKTLKICSHLERGSRAEDDKKNLENLLSGGGGCLFGTREYLKKSLFVKFKL